LPQLFEGISEEGYEVFDAEEIARLIVMLANIKNGVDLAGLI
jgi:hypothetical protein